MNLPVSVAVLLGRTTKENQFAWKNFVVVDGSGSGSVYQGRKVVIPQTDTGWCEWGSCTPF